MSKFFGWLVIFWRIQNQQVSHNRYHLKVDFPVLSRCKEKNDNKTVYFNRFAEIRIKSLEKISK